MSVKVAFYKAEGRLFDKVIRWWTKSPYSHCEIISRGLGLSSSGRDGGVRGKFIDWKPESWDYLTVDGIDENQVFAWFAEHQGQKYDWFGLLWFVIPIRWENRTHWFCSEACAEALGLKDTWKYSPQSLYEELRDRAPVATAAGIPV